MISLVSRILRALWEAFERHFTLEVDEEFEPELVQGALARLDPLFLAYHLENLERIKQDQPLSRDEWEHLDYLERCFRWELQRRMEKGRKEIAK